MEQNESSVRLGIHPEHLLFYYNRHHLEDFRRLHKRFQNVTYGQVLQEGPESQELRCGEGGRASTARARHGGDLSTEG